MQMRRPSQADLFKHRGRGFCVELLAAANDLYDRYRVARREGLSESVIELVVDAFPFRILRS